MKGLCDYCFLQTFTAIKMNLFYILGVLIPNMTTIFILFRFFDKIYKSKYSHTFYIILYFCIVFFQTFVTFLKIPFISLITFSITVVLLSLFAYQTTGKNKLIFTLMYVIYLTFLDIVIVPLLANYTNTTVDKLLTNNEAFFITGIISSISGLCTYQIVIQQMQKRSIRLLTKNQEFFIIFLGLFELNMIHAILKLRNYNLPASNSITINMFIGFILIDIYIVYLFESVSKNNELELKNSLLEQQEYLNKRYYEELELHNNDYRKIMHDFSKHIHIIQQTSTVNNSYCEEVLEQINSIGNKFYCTCQVLNIIINNTFLLCENKNIPFIPHIENIDLSFMKEIDITTIFLNLIDNAIEANAEIISNKRYIHLTIKNVQNHMVVNITNPYLPHSSTVSTPLIFSKKKHIGLGLENVRTALDKYNSILTIAKTDENFTAKFIISLPILK